MSDREMIAFLDTQAKHRTKKLHERSLKYGRRKK